MDTSLATIITLEEVSAAAENYGLPAPTPSHFFHGEYRLGQESLKKWRNYWRSSAAPGGTDTSKFVLRLIGTYTGKGDIYFS